MRKGIAVSPGVTVGTAYCIHEIYVNPSTKRLAQGEVATELARYEDARERSLKDVRALRRKVESQVGWRHPKSNQMLYLQLIRKA